jgi:hypothetical protein
MIVLTNQEMSGHSLTMASIKVRSKVDEQVWSELCAMAEETHQNVSGLLTEAIREYLLRHRVRPEVLEHLDASVERNRRLGELLAK